MVAPFSVSLVVLFPSYFTVSCIVSWIITIIADSITHICHSYGPLAAVHNQYLYLCLFPFPPFSRPAEPFSSSRVFLLICVLVVPGIGIVIIFTFASASAFAFAIFSAAVLGASSKCQNMRVLFIFTLIPVFWLINF